MHQKFGFTGVMVSHEFPEIFGISDWVAMLSKGTHCFDGAVGRISTSLTDPEPCASLSPSAADAATCRSTVPPVSFDRE